MGKGDDEDKYEKEGFFRRIMRVVSCRRRAPPANDLPAGFRELVKTAKGLSSEETTAFAKMAYWSVAETKQSARCFVLAPCVAGGDYGEYVDMAKLLAYCVSKMHDHVVTQDKEYAVVWLQYSTHRIGPLAAWNFKRSLPERYALNLEAVHVVHPSWGIRFMRLFLWPFAQEVFWDVFQSHERIEFLDTSIKSVKNLELSRHLYEYDRFLDKQAEEMAREANKQMGHQFAQSEEGDPNDADTKTYQDQIAEIQRLIKAQGLDAKMD